jgi:DNA-directed RNA polymerase specialized sigma24 family protein
MAWPHLTPPSEANQPHLPAPPPGLGGGAATTQDPPEPDFLAPLVDEARLRMQHAIDRLPEPNRAALQLKFYRGLDAYQVADVLDIPMLAARSVIVEGLRRLQGLL